MNDREVLRDLFCKGAGNEAEHVIIYAGEVTPRLRYTCKFIFGTVLGMGHTLTSNESQFTASPLFRVNYSFRDLQGAYRVKPNAFLLGRSMLEKHPPSFFRNGQLYYFPNNDTNGGLHFDLFSAVFYFISRHEEWQDFHPDRHQRFEAQNSILFNTGFLEKPIVDQWVMEFAHELRKVFPAFSIPKRNFVPVSTIDVDNLYAYRGKGLVRNAGGLLKDLLSGRPGSALERLLVLAGLRTDPFDVYAKVSAFCGEKNLPLFFFFLLRHKGRYDRTIDPGRGVFEPVIAGLAQRHAVGLHPSYGSAYNADLLEEELQLFVKLSGQKAVLSRQHYLRFDIRKTPTMLLEHGIVADFTMGFAGAPGFRAGTSHPFYYYDFRKEEETPLLLVPFCFMDGAFSVYQRRRPAEAMPSLLTMAKHVRETGGYFTTVFHERSFSDRLYRGFGTLYKNLHQKLSEQGME